MQSNIYGSSRAGGVGTTLSLVLLVTLLTAAAALLSFRQLQPNIERELTARVTTALQGSVGDGFKIEGQDVYLTGSVSSEAVSKRATDAARSVYGVSRVINNLTIDGNESAATSAEGNSDQNSSPAAPLIVDTTATAAAPPTLTIASRQGRISVQGIVPDNETIELISTTLAGKFGRANVRNELSSFGGSTPPEWLRGMVSMIDQLDGISNPVLKVTGEDVVIGGVVNAEQIRRAKIATADRLLGENLNIVDNLTVKAAPAETPQTADATKTIAKADTAAVAAEDKEEAVVKTAIVPPTPVKTVDTRPASVKISSENNQITLSGLVGPETDTSGLREGLNNLFGIGGYFDELKVSNSVDAASWIDDALIVTSEIRHVSEFVVNIRAGQMSLSGNVEDRETARDLSIAATEIAGNKLGVLNNFSVSRISASNSEEDLIAESLMQELNALPTRNIVFNKGSTTLTNSAKSVLDDVAAAILGYDDLVVEIAGHTDSSGDAVTNLNLSKQRAAAVRDYLVEKDVPSSRLSPIGYGETAPITSNDTGAGRAANRRIEFNI